MGPASLILNVDLLHQSISPSFPLSGWPDAKNLREVACGKWRARMGSGLASCGLGMLLIGGRHPETQWVWEGRKWVCTGQCLELHQKRLLGQSMRLEIRTSEVTGLLLFIEPRRKRCSFLASHEAKAGQQCSTDIPTHRSSVRYGPRKASREWTFVLSKEEVFKISKG